MIPLEYAEMKILYHDCQFRYYWRMWIKTQELHHFGTAKHHREKKEIYETFKENCK